MQSRKSVSLIATLLLLLLLSTLVTRAHAFTNGQSASLVIGQKDFTSGSFAGASQSRLTGPDYVIFDSSGNLWVGDTTNNRVLEFRTPFSTGMNASLVIGQPDFVTSTPVTSQSGLNFVSQAERVAGFAFDSTGNLWVADLGNNRVLEFKSPFSMGMPASLVIGQKDFTTAGLATTKDGLVKPSAVAFDHSNNLWVVDGRNFRVLEFNPPFNNGMSASLVIGQADFETNKPSASQTGLTNNGDLAIDTSDNVWVADNSRVLEFRAPFSNGMNASVVIGQASFATSKPSIGRTGLSGPQAITTDSAGNLWVSDSGNNRMLEFEPPFSNGMGASLVLGQQDFNSSLSATTQSGFSGGLPGHPALDSSGNLWVPDWGNNRLLEFSSTVVPEFPTASLAIIAVASLAIVALVLRRFPMRRLDQIRIYA